VNAFLDTSVVLASLDPDESHHLACDRLIAAGGHRLYVHALAETFSILTGGRQGRRLGPAAAARLIEQSVLPYVQAVALEGSAMAAALVECERRGVRGGAVYDWLHLASARAAGADVLYTLNLRDFQALAVPGDPRVEMP
jgi:predicted nucleic acid-binding protein